MFVPSRKLKVSTSPPWIDGEVRNLQNKKRTAWKRAKRSDSPSHWEKFRKLRNKLKNLLSAKYNKYLVSLSSTLQESPKRFWAFVRAKSKSRSLPTDVHLNGTVVQSAPDKANMFNDYFFSTFSAPDPNVIKPDIDMIMFGFGGNLLAWFTSYLTDRRQRVVVEGCQSKWLPSRKLMSLVEGVQRRATKFILGAHSNTLTYKERLSTLGLLPLAHRREVCDVMVFIKSKPIVHKPSRYLRSHMLTPIRVRTSAFSSSYIPRLVTIWNQLSPVLRNIGVQASEMSNILTFKRSLVWEDNL
ncbi:hypothetical protein Bbelb_038400 [Branchiostoma belcheri]|nr:hypothetical protein Bbelb_038400 [Branchiostoma belcheri]